MPVQEGIFQSSSSSEAADPYAAFLRSFRNRHSTADDFLTSLPFTATDATGGSEHELQAVVIGKGDDIDLVRAIRHSNFFANIVKQAASGDVSRRDVEELQQFIGGKEKQVWENSWVRFRRDRLHKKAELLLKNDLRRDKGEKDSPLRADADRFLQQQDGKNWLRLPISYLLKLALADILGTCHDLPDLLRRKGERLLENFTNDNSSPETVSFYVCSPQKPGKLGRELAWESAIRFLLSQALAGYANSQFGLQQSGQTVRVYFSPLPGRRQKKLNTLIPDSFYRKLFMSPCLSGWQQGEAKHRYMVLCHQALSRSQLNAVGKLKEAGIITRNLVVLPNTSNISLANNGVHISLGSKKLAAWMHDGTEKYGRGHEKYFGDLAIKFMEHFMPLFVGTYSAAPHRLDFTDFHPEVALGFLAHELDYTHLRMLWRRWKKKAAIKVAGQPLTPFGPSFIDRQIGRMFGLQGDYVPDFRLVDYFVSMLSTDQCPALNGVPGNLERLKEDLDSHGVFDRRMATYLLCRIRHLDEMGFSGFEGRSYSLFASFATDMAEAADLQVLLTAIAFRHIFSGELHHRDIPDTPTVESERRQTLFGAALGIPTFYVRHNTANRFLRTILAQVEGIRKSRRYPGYLRVTNHAYRSALVQYIRQREAPLVEMMQAEGMLASLEDRLREENGLSAVSKLSKPVLDRAGKNTPLQMPADEFNQSMEEYYRKELRLQQIKESCSCLGKLFKQARQDTAIATSHVEKTVHHLLRGQPLTEFIVQAMENFMQDREDPVVLRKLACLIILVVSLNDTGEKNITSGGNPPVIITGPRIST